MTVTLIKTLLVSYLFFLICLVSVSGYSLIFFPYLSWFSFYFIFYMSFCLSCYSVFLLLCFYVILSSLLLCLLCHSVSLLLCLYTFCFSCYFVFSCHSVFFLTLFLCHSVSFHHFVALPLPYFSSSFWLRFYPFICLFFDIFAWIFKYIKILLSFYFFVCLSTLFLFSFVIYVIEFLI